MKNIEEINKASVKKILAKKKKIPEFFAGDTIKIGVRTVSYTHLTLPTKRIV